ncbi:hypothetical protein IQ249_06645 [Lusitaniella coriacea LEGE 07157]|uniref:Uncharacterized protein n=1 Tax=Lusitaniella coriacea LEGE 07157 TaxID=945747 RepID=A0A8J7IT10_9CYAN|nr:hypothetical protein [Lusitaniella coriacea LEGE 07157]
MCLVHRYSVDLWDVELYATAIGNSAETPRRRQGANVRHKHLRKPQMTRTWERSARQGTVGRDTGTRGHGEFL